MGTPDDLPAACSRLPRYHFRCTARNLGHDDVWFQPINKGTKRQSETPENKRCNPVSGVSGLDVSPLNYLVGIALANVVVLSRHEGLRLQILQEQYGGSRIQLLKCLMRGDGHRVAQLK